jgi:hypothetical protein
MRGRLLPQVLFAVAFAMAISYRDLELPRFPVSDGTSPKCARNAEIRARHEKGESIAMPAKVFGVTKQRIWQILNDRRKRVGGCVIDLLLLEQQLVAFVTTTATLRKGKPEPARGFLARRATQPAHAMMALISERMCNSAAQGTLFVFQVSPTLERSPQIDSLDKRSNPQI